MPWVVLLLLLGSETVETEHYRLVSEGPRAEAEEFGRILEAAYGGYAAYFSAKPKLGKDSQSQPATASHSGAKCSGRY